MQYCRYNIDEELKKASEGERTKEEVELLLYFALKGQPITRKRIAKPIQSQRTDAREAGLHRG